ncbi:MAG: tRNA uridine-5-carboxymethylaminomethyl(34) synthesis GTPase MnmE, partial [Dysgonamonadaceae bacterium]|nr:tRNA uridine-5-carboxymethylaminomethyl(34) synthesis GTPase MnmE [Dysgonamonadaceae bacterium]
MNDFIDRTTICAISTPAGRGGIAIIRVSGSEAITVADKIVQCKQSLDALPAKTLALGMIHKDGELLDEIMISVFRAPDSFTGEDMVEINCHGSIFIQQEIMQLLLANGCRMARGGEFTQRAFLNGKIDLSQAEAVADVITSSSASAHRMAMSQMRGGFSNELQNIRSQLVKFASLIELELDFSEEDVEFADRTLLQSLIESIRTDIEHLATSFKLGNVIKNGVPVAIVGETNAGKSTLLNLLLNEEKAIVSDTHGTTRDAIEDVVNINGIAFRFIDTAGLRDTKDKVEKLGIEKTYRKIEQANIIIWMVDATQFSEKIEHIAEKIIPRTVNKKLIIIINKVDRLSTEEQEVLNEEFLPDIKAERIYLSAKFNQNTQRLENALLKAVNLPNSKE